jgi:hypothetical protein
MSDNAYTRTFRRAIETLGTVERLAKALGASVEEIESWVIGAAVPPPGAFLLAIDIVAGGRLGAAREAKS